MGIEIAGASGATIGGAAAAANIISGNTVDGINLNKMNPAPGLPASANTIKGNYIGLNAAGTAAVPNGFAGISISEGVNNVIGSTLATEMNVISGNAGPGILIGSSGNVATNTVIGNRIGTNPAGTVAIGNGGNGVLVNGNFGSVPGTVIGGAGGARNVISGNGAAGILVVGAGATATSIGGNYIGVGADGLTDLGNTGSGIDVSGANSTAIGPANVISGNAYGVINNNPDGTQLTANRIGTDATGNVAVANLAGGVLFNNPGGAGGYTITGNQISGNEGFAGISINATTIAGLIDNNIIGMNSTGLAPLGNDGNGIDIDNGGATIVTNNVVSANNGDGIYVVASNGAVVSRNTVGLDSNGVTAFPNSFHGINVEFLSNALVGGAGAGDGNLASGNNIAGIRIHNAANTNVRGNKVGTDITGTLARHNGEGIIVSGTSSGTIGGDNALTRNIVSGNLGIGVKVVNAGGIQIDGNYIGVNAAGAAALPNSIGMEIQAGTVHVGDFPPGHSNVISGNTLHGMHVTGGAAANHIFSNIIGAGPAPGLAAIPNGGDGLRVTGGSPWVFADLTAYNVLNGITVIGTTAVNISSTVSYSNGGLPIDLGNDGPTANDALDADGGANNLQNYPQVTASNVDVGGELFSTPNTAFSILFITGDAVGNARNLLTGTNCNTDAAGHCFIGPVPTALASGTFVTAIARDPAGNTSEMGFWFVVP
jgi:parallel beta-helix repeat protein